MRRILIGIAIGMLAVAPWRAANASPSAVESTWGLPVLNALARDPHNLVIPFEKWQLKGFEEKTNGVRVPTVQRVADGASVTAISSVAGTYYPGFILYDSEGDERVSIRVDGVERGVAIAGADDNREHLYYLSEPQRLQRGSAIELHCLTHDGAYLIEGVILLSAKPPAREFRYTISELFAQPEREGGKASAELTWLTNWPARCAVEWGAEGTDQTETAAEPLALNNHRLMLAGLRTGQTYRFRVTATTRNGHPIACEWRRFTTREMAPPPGTVTKARVTLSIRNPQQAHFDGIFPVTSGVPFPRGVLSSDVHLRLLDARDQEVPLQTEVLARWLDGSVKWVLLDLQANPSQSGAYSLEYGRAVTRRNFASPLQVVDSEEAITVSTGTLHFAIPKRGPGLLKSLSLADGREMLGGHSIGLELTGSDGTTYTTLGPPDEVVEEEAGPLRATVRLSGHYRAADGRELFGYTLRVQAYAGQPYVRLEHTFTNDSGDNEFTSIRSLTLRVPLQSARGDGHWSLGATPGQEGTFQDSSAASLQQHTDDHYTVGREGGEPAVEGQRALGWSQWRSDGRRVTLAVRDFWQTYPKDLTVTRNGLELAICPPLKTDEYAAAKGTVDEHRLYYYLQGGLYKFREGMSQTQDIWLEGTPDQSGATVAAVQTQRAPLLALAPAAWYNNARVLGNLPPPEPNGLVARYDAAFALNFGEYWKNHERDREYGMLNFGDWWGERGVDWGDSEYDTQNAFLRQFLRTGDLLNFTAAEQMEWHNRDVDTIHYHRDTSRIGGVYHHAIGHTGDYYPKGVVPGNGIAVGILTVDHVWTQGHFAYYFLTGDRRSLETARMIADRYDTYVTRNYDFDNCRNAGWHLILTMAAYQATRDRFYLNAAKIIVERAVERQTPNGGWDFYGICMPPDPPTGYGNFGFTVGILLTGLREYYEATGDEHAAREIVHGANFLAHQLWLPQTNLFRYCSCPNAPAVSGLTFLLLDGVAFAHKRTGDPLLGKMLIATTEKSLESMEGMNPVTAHQDQNGVGKEIGLYICNAPEFIGYVAALQRKESHEGKAPSAPVGAHP